MSLWWAQREQLDENQVALIENLPLREDYLVLGPPGLRKDKRPSAARTICPDPGNDKRPCINIYPIPR